MPTFFSKSGSFKALTVTGSSLTVISSSVYFKNLTTTSQNNVVTIDTTTGQLFYTASSAIGGGGTSTPPGGSDKQIQYNSSSAFGGVPTLTYDGTILRATGSFTGSFTGSLQGTASWANNVISASYAVNGGVTQLLAGPNVTLSPTTGVGQVTISSTGGGSSFNTATGSYGSFYSTQTQTNVASTARSMSLNTTDISNGVSVSGSTNPFNTYIKVENAGVYDIQFSAQVDKTDSGTDEIWIWLRKNGSDVSDSATSLQLIGNGAHYVAAWNFFVNAAANDYFQLMWYSPDANVRLHAEAGFGVVPGIPSLIVTANRVDQFLSNTGSFSGSFTGTFSGSLFGTSSWAQSASLAVTAITSSYPISVTGSTLYSVNPSAGSNNTNNGIFFGNSAGLNATNASQSNFLGLSAGANATNASQSNFLGNGAGNGATNANTSNFLGYQAGSGATNASQSNFLGSSAGLSATNANSSNFLGSSTGQSATNANNSNFIGRAAGASATNANNSNFIGSLAGNNATNAIGSNFIGYQAGRFARSASYSVLIGYNAGINTSDTVYILSNNTIIGTNITLPAGSKDSINLGGIIFATGSYSTTTGSPFSGSADGKVGINIYPPSYSLHVSGTTVVGQYNTNNNPTDAFIVGVGSSNTNKLDGFTVTTSGSISMLTQSVAPTWTGREGEIVPVNNGGSYFIYVYIGGQWRSSSLS